ncbi:MAG TPA: bifunctional oligoribonuclease/PAP phosphatase NrnA [Flavobacteriaceae bacterium]|nr:bifunctional oligoribonuclease/PAP phosphatase NrnA [Flavobacteriaceae bacterium]
MKRLLDSPKKIVIVPHKNPDGDALGASLALFLFLKAKDHKVNVVSPNDYPEFLKWLPGESEIIKFDQDNEKGKMLLSEAELIFTLDFNDFSRTGEMEKFLQKSSAEFVMIDHHQQPSNYARFTESDTAMSSTSEMIYNFLEQLDQLSAVTPEMATCLYTGIMTDTGSFRFPSTSSQTHKVIAFLMERGAKNAEIYQQVYDTNSLDSLHLLGVALMNIRVLKEYRAAYISLSQEELDAHNYKKGDTEGFVNYILSLKNIIFAVIFIENKQEGIIKMSLRSKGDFDVNRIARKYYHGGGHRNAAGGKSLDNMEKTIKKFVNMLSEYENELL